MYVADFNAMLLNVFLDVVTDSNVLLDMLQKWPQFSDNLSLLYYKGPCVEAFLILQSTSSIQLY